MPIRRLEDTLTATTATIAGEDIAASSIPVKPHIQPGVLQPAVAGKLLGGGNHSGAYGTAQSDGHSYYYTDIKGSKPIKDPRIGAHFGSQRHKFKSLQLLEQETATHGENTYSIDGREWCRVVGNSIVFYGDGGSCIQSDSANSVAVDFYVEIVGYFNDFNCLSRTRSIAVDDINVTVNGTTTNSANTDKLGGKTSDNSPLRNRYVDMGSIINHDDSTVATNLGTTPKINTIKLEAINTGSEYWQFFGIELIAQDTTSTANKSKIQIPAQNVVSYGKKFALSAAAQHYNPFDGMSGAKTLAQLGDYIDTATSLGMENWKGGTSNYYRPFNGGRVVKWVASDGTIKTSVTMMPPNAQNYGGTASNAVSDAHIQAGTNDDTINFDTTTIANATPLHEVAKTFYWREFGNGSANGGTGASSWADASMLSQTEDDIAYCMDDGLTSLWGNVKEGGSMLYRKDADSFSYATFIGTGITKTVINSGVTAVFTIAQNLPYGTHILYQDMDSSTTAADWYIDGVKVADITGGSPNYEGEEFFYDMIIHQPKKPPIPEDACILADYMLMANFVPRTSNGARYISKGVRYCSASRDVHCNGSAFTLYGSSVSAAGGFMCQAGSPDSDTTFTNISFSTNMVFDGYDLSGSSSVARRVTWKTNGTTVADGDLTYNATETDTHGTYSYPTASTTLGNNTYQQVGTNSSGHGSATEGSEYVSPIHTSSHYQTFETPYLKELVGGDRNMEQTNLVVTADGKSWDEITRDTSYIGNFRWRASVTEGQISQNVSIDFDEHRGTYHNGTMYLGIKDFAYGYDRIICLKDGEYQLNWTDYWDADATAQQMRVLINGSLAWRTENSHTANTPGVICLHMNLKRGDYIELRGTGANMDHANNYPMSHWHIVKV